MKKKKGSVLMTTMEPLEMMVQRKKIKKIMDRPEHPLHETLIEKENIFRQKLLQIRCKTDCSFLPTAITIYNNYFKHHLHLLFEKS